MGKKLRPIVMISSWPPRLCGIATFAEEAVEFIRKAAPERKVYIISHTDGEGEFVRPIIDMSRKTWYLPVVDAIRELDPEVIHIQHEYGLYEYQEKSGKGDKNRGLLKMLDMLSDYPIVIEPHTIHGRMKADEEEFVKSICQKCSVVFFKCPYQKWRLDWTFTNHGWEIPTNIMIVPHGARPDYRWAINQVDDLKKELGLGGFVGEHIIGLIGWIQSNKRWDILTSMWEEIYYEIRERTGKEWFLFAAGDMRDPNHKQDYEKYVAGVKWLENAGIAKYYQFIPRGEIYYKVMAICDFIVLPSLDETQSGTLARVISLNKPFITTAPMEGLTSQTVESEGGLLFTSKKSLKRSVLRLAMDENLRLELGTKLRDYLDTVVSWEIVAKQYLEAYGLAVRKVHKGFPIYIRPEFP
jgi:glycosyltransferase involved in cell wall biosynthesis